MPVSINFDKAITEKAAVQKGITVSSSSGQEVACHWFNANRMDCRPEDYWKEGSTVTLKLALDEVEGAKGVYGVQQKTVTFKIGRNQVSYVDAQTKQMKVTQDGKTVKTIPISAGSPENKTYEGQMVISENFKETRMNGATVGFTDDDGEGEVRHQGRTAAMRLSTSGTFIHGNYWGAKSVFGSVNTSHGCVGLSDTKGANDPSTPAAWFYEHSLIGDVVVVKNTGDKTIAPDNGLNGWNMDWAQWKAGSAVDAGPRAVRKPSSARGGGGFSACRSSHRALIQGLWRHQGASLVFGHVLHLPEARAAPPQKGGARRRLRPRAGHRAGHRGRLRVLRDGQGPGQGPAVAVRPRHRHDGHQGRANQAAPARASARASSSTPRTATPTRSKSSDRVMVQGFQTLAASTVGKVSDQDGVADAVGGLSLQVLKVSGEFTRGRLPAGRRRGRPGRPRRPGRPAGRGAGRRRQLRRQQLLRLRHRRHRTRPRPADLLQDHRWPCLQGVRDRREGRRLAAHSSYAKEKKLKTGSTVTVKGTKYKVIGIATAEHAGTPPPTSTSR
ncbi:hypothetical protein SFUMM280S_03834 [Streptomyces fumanus]